MYLQVDCNSPLGNIYAEVLDLVEVSLSMSTTILLLILSKGNIHSLMSAARETVLSTTKDPRLDD